VVFLLPVIQSKKEEDIESTVISEIQLEKNPLDVNENHTEQNPPVINEIPQEQNPPVLTDIPLIKGDLENPPASSSPTPQLRGIEGELSYLNIEFPKI
jgi:hypothetical protein